MPDLLRPIEEHDIPMRPRHVPDVRRPHHGVPYMPEASREAHSTLLAYSVHLYTLVTIL